MLYTVLLFIGALVVRPLPAAAEFLQYDGMGHRSVVTVMLNGVQSGPFYAGEINWLWQDEAPAGFEEAIYTYCVDPFNHLTKPQEVILNSTDYLPDPYSVGDPGGQAAWLFNTFAEGIRTAGTDIQAAGLQVAIWEAIYATAFSIVVSDDVYGGRALAESIRTQSEYYLGRLATEGYHRSAVWLEAPTGQDQITSRDVADVPEPASLLLFGLAAPYFVRRRRN
ncbi:MAG: PEP-CTERM sorting domain-containing protein [Vicinamibacterales bacterium]